MNYLLRDIKLSKLTNIPLVGDASKLVKFWEELCCDMEVKVDPSKGEIRCWKNNYDYYYFIQDDKNSEMWCNYAKVWLFFDNELRLDYDEIQELIQYMLNKSLNHVVNTPKYSRIYIKSIQINNDVNN